jgi:hypothetical protein
MGTPGTADQQERETAVTGVLQATEDYLEASEQLSTALKAGWFSLARAKYAGTGGASALARYPGDMKACAVVSLVPPENPDGIYDRFELRAAQPAAGPSGKRSSGGEKVGGSGGATAAAAAGGGGAGGGATAAAAAGGGGAGGGATAAAAAGGGGAGGVATTAAGGCSASDEAATTSGTASGGTTSGSGDPLNWFGGGLPSADLRQAQQGFQGALRAAVAAANRLQRLRAAADGLGEGGGGGSSGDEGGLEAGNGAEEFSGEVARLMSAMGVR